MQKKLLVVLLGVIIVVVLLTIFFVSPRASQDNKYISFTNTLKSKILTYTDNKRLPEKIVIILNQLNDPKISDQEKYNALKDLEFYFSNQYSSSHDPSVRDFVKNVMGDFAKNNLSKYYKESDFNEACADPKCGQEIDKGLSQILELINTDKNIDKDYKINFTMNLNTVAYLPNSDVMNKQFGLQLIASGLESVGKKSASDTANLIKIYFKEKYGKDLFTTRL